MLTRDAVDPDGTPAVTRLLECPPEDRPAYGRRGRMSANRRTAYATRYVRLGLPDAAAVIAYDPEIVEIGFGAGESLADLAAERPDLRILGVEVFEPGVHALLRTIDERRLDNLRVARTNATSLLPQLQPGRLHLVRVLFPDPWPKRRHAHRRLLREPMIQTLARLLAADGLLHVATDVPAYAAEIAAAAAACTDLRPTSPPARTATRFEDRARRAGHPVTDLAWRRA